MSPILEHMRSSYLNTRWGMALIALMLPILVVVTGAVFDDLPLQSSLSAYYWATNTGANQARIPFVGLLVTLGCFLFLYKGFTREEDHVLNMGGVSAICVAWFPMDIHGSGLSIHGAFALLLFFSLAYVIGFRAADTLPYLDDPDLERRYLRRYRVLGLCMLVAPVVAAGINFVFGANHGVLLAEVLGTWSFALFWALKERELQYSQV